MALDLNQQLFNQAKQYIAGGVNSPLRSFRAVGGNPIFIKSARGAKIYSQDGREFIDYCLGFGAIFLGHSHPRVRAALHQAIDKGSCFGAPTNAETELAKLIIRSIPAIESIRFVNSGTEAVMSAVRLARAFTKKNKIIKFQGAYHGHMDYLLDSDGVPQDFKKHTITLPYNNIGKLKQVAGKYKHSLAAIIVESIAGNMGVVLPQEGFLVSLRKICHRYNCLLISDEVITGFRLKFGIATDLFKVRPDLVCLGKVIGQGLPFAAFGGKREIMQLLSPQGNVYQAGTFCGNPLSVNAGLACLRQLYVTRPYKKLARLTQQLCQGIRESAKLHKLKIQVNSIGPIFSIFFGAKEVTDYQTAKTQDTQLFKKFYHKLLEQGIYFSPSGFEANFLSCAHTRQDIEKTLKAVEGAFKNLGNSSALASAPMRP